VASNGRLAGKAAIVTGSGSGLGKASALRFAREGAQVACADIDVDAAEVVAAEIASQGATAIAVQVDTTLSAAADAMVGAALAAFGKIDVLFSNAGISGPGNAADVSEDLWDRVIAVNLKGVWLSAKAVLPHMMSRRTGVILNQASMAALVGIDNIFPYTAAKGGVTAMTRQIGRRLRSPQRPRECHLPRDDPDSAGVPVPPRARGGDGRCRPGAPGRTGGGAVPAQASGGSRRRGSPRRVPGQRRSDSRSSVWGFPTTWQPSPCSWPATKRTG
jgi:NADP-dependent 3-hydroxy acid dehydrogenase YdfG